MPQSSTKTAIITGGTRGIGLQTAKLLVENGYEVIAIGRSFEAFFKEPAAWKSQVTGIECDLSDQAAIQALIQEIKTKHNAIDLLINNAASQTEMDFFDFSKTENHTDISVREIALNLSAPITLTLGLLEELQRAPAGAVVNISSGLALAPKTASPTYCATKAALSSFSKGLRYQCIANKSPVNIVEVILPMVETDMTKGRGSGKISPEQAAAEIFKGIEQGKPEIWVAKAKLLRIINRIAPELSARILR
ncbi:SDR family oxidoreductase [Maritalea sp.]|uniref:SDR family oxidoreductase n=1 Tax=Maritalea sp. TaxID=2003361 RepID=UPI003EFAD28A